MKASRTGTPAKTMWMWIWIIGLSLILLAGCSAAGAPEGAAPTPQVSPTQVGTALPTTEMALSPAQIVADALASLEKGRLLYNPPSEMEFGDTARVEARISFDSAADLSGDLQGSGQPVEESIPVSNFMKVQLKGQAFEITPLNSDEQIVTNTGYTQWAWDVTPKKSGDQNLVLTVSARVKIPDYPDESKDIQVVERLIQVRVGPGQAVLNFMGQNLGWIVPTLLSACVAGIGWAWRRRKSKPNPTEERETQLSK